MGAEERVTDLWARVEVDLLPPAVVEAFQAEDWPRLRVALRHVMDAITTDGPYGRALLQVVRSLPLGVDDLFTRYRAAAAIDFGDWDDLGRCLALGVSRASELQGVRDIFIAPVDRTEAPRGHDDAEQRIFDAIAPEFERAPRKWLRWARRMATFDAAPRLDREDVATARHFRYRALHQAVTHAVGELQAGNLPVAIAFARTAQSLGEPGEPWRDVAHDIAALGPAGLGETTSPRLRFPARTASSIGMSPFGTWETLVALMPLLCLLNDGHFEWAARLADDIARRLASPRAQLQSAAWLAAANVKANPYKAPEDLQPLLIGSRSAAPGLRALPEFIDGVTGRRELSLLRAERLARRSGNVWLQVSALTWLTALNPRPQTSRSLLRLLNVTGWRRPPLVAADVTAEAALGLMASGTRGRAVVELAAASGRPNAVVEVARAHIDAGTEQEHVAAVVALTPLRIASARELLRRRSGRNDSAGNLAKQALLGHSAQVLSDREVEVLELAGEGLTNRQIADRLVLSEHTVARHIANARAKLGATSRHEAVRKLETLSGEAGYRRS